MELGTARTSLTGRQGKAKTVTEAGKKGDRRVSNLYLDPTLIASGHPLSIFSLDPTLTSSPSNHNLDTKTNLHLNPNPSLVSSSEFLLFLLQPGPKSIPGLEFRSQT